MIGVIAVAVLLAVVIGIGVIVYRGTEGEIVHLIPTPRGPLPVPTDAQLLTALEDHGQGFERLNGDRYCTDCMGWFGPGEWKRYDVPVVDDEGVQEGHKVTTEWVHQCPTED